MSMKVVQTRGQKASPKSIVLHVARRAADLPGRCGAKRKKKHMVNRAVGSYGEQEGDLRELGQPPPIFEREEPRNVLLPALFPLSSHLPL